MTTIARATKKFIFRIKRVFEFIKLGLKDQDWDYGYLLFIERKKYQWMYEYFSNADITESEWEHARDIKIMLGLLDIIEEKDTAYIYHGVEEAVITAFTTGKPVSMEGHFTLNPDKYVNTRNASRFIHSRMMKHINDKGSSMHAIVVNDLRYEKAWHLYHKIRSEKMRSWWD